ncbi:MAG: hypothetical protein COV30_00835 [Candidatus Yanofskybacteria bacterium CG10_big_fil_rev_8_21_14_0_10_37_15]|uniref:Uncharacterized protein n=1 Tax=Candidatus Yanofskybacteria bacterium CG10_big_fil_rev_8_21_14_0_10_37_15 TaxID=1975097 RepID=A0A2H0R629_9BACT|nr:MAG: hypothetical protein COV30_00835 [Candidatus Yanofskybacteria bacterium CG10_big_fil_rev_8_21_14_0_10_37_15]
MLNKFGHPVPPLRGFSGPNLLNKQIINQFNHCVLLETKWSEMTKAFACGVKDLMVKFMDKDKKYVMHVVEGSLVDSNFLSQFSPKKLDYLDDKNWGYLIEVNLTLDEIKEVQKKMVKHYEGPEPWYMDGYAIYSRDEVICAFGADDGENGKIFVFKRDDKKAFREVKTYALSKGIPEEQIDFLN